MRMAIVSAAGEVENVVDATPGFDPGAGRAAIPAPAAVDAGWTWSRDGFSPPRAAASVPEKVSDLQFRLALNISGLREQAEDVLQNGGQDLRDYWDRALEIERRHPLMELAGRRLGKNEAEIDALFVLAASL